MIVAMRDGLLKTAAYWFMETKVKGFKFILPFVNVFFLLKGDLVCCIIDLLKDC